MFALLEPVSAPAADAWGFGWEALVALGTLGLAVATGGLAWLTKRLASAARDDERAQWRPVLVPDRYRNSRGMPLQIGQGAAEVVIRMRNAGRGPALHIRS